MSTPSEISPSSPDPLPPPGATEPDPDAAGSGSGCWNVFATVMVSAAILLLAVGIIMPMFGSAGPAVAMTTASMNAANIYKALTLYAQDHEGKFPESIHSSNEAFRKLFDDYIETEKPFYVPGSAWHQTSPGGKGADDDIGSPPDFVECLQTGENHWAYVSGLTLASAGHLPLLMDGFVPDAPGTYTKDPRLKGGWWRGKATIVVYMDGSVRQEKLDPRTLRVRREQPRGSGTIDPLAKENLPSGTTLLNPE